MLKKTKDAVRKEQLADNVTLFCGDCREIIPTLKGVDALVSDPPYAIQDIVTGYGRTQLSGGAGVSFALKHRTIANDHDLGVVTEAVSAARKIMPRNAWCALFYSCRITPRFFSNMTAAFKESEYFGEMVWDKNAPGMGRQIRYRHENIAFFRLGDPEPLEDCGSLFTFAPLRGDAKSDGHDGHPHEKPDRVMDNVVSVIPCKMILDCFMGTGSTGAAAVRAKRGFIGIELDPRHFETAIRKVKAALDQPTAFWND